MSSLLDRMAELSSELPRGWKAALARACGVAPPSVSDWVSGKSKSLEGENLLRAAAFFNVTPEWLATGKGRKRADQTEPKQLLSLDNNPEYPAIRRVQFKLSAGASGYAVDYRDGDGAPIVFQRQWFESRGLIPEKLFAIKVANGSMEPGLHDDDTVVVNTASTVPKDGVVFAVNYEGELVIKRLVRDSGEWWLSSDNADQARYPRKHCHEGVHLIGEIVHKQSEHI